jgi:hypothetical protein
MRGLLFCLLLAPFAVMADPATLQVALRDGKYLSFRLENHYQSPVTKFEVTTAFGEQGHFDCGIVAEVKRPEDLHPAATCGLPVDGKTGKVTDSRWKARIVYVEFADGMRWIPRQ